MASAGIGKKTFAAALPGVPANISGVWLFWLMTLLLCMVDLADGVLFLGDVDDRMRALQIRDLLADGQWFDRTLPFIAMPETYVSPWSRLVDLPYAAITWLLSPVLGVETALSLAVSIWPPILALAFCLAAFAVMRRLGGDTIPALHLGATALAMTYALWEFTPGRIDHHNVQLVLMMAMLAGFCLRSDSNRLDLGGGALAGIAAVLSVAVGLECLPFILAALGLVGVFALAGDSFAKRQIAAAGIAMTVSAPLAGLLLIGPQAMLTTACDAWSAPWIAAMTGGGIILSGFALPRIGRLGWSRRLGVFGLAGVALVISLAAAFPACLQGPYAMVDDVARSFWLDRVAQEETALSFVAERRYGLLAILALCAFILTATARQAYSEMQKGDWRFALVWLVGFAAFALTLWQVRFIRFAPAFVPLLLPWLIAALRENPPRIARPVLAASALLPVGALALTLLATPHREREFDAVDLMTWDECEGADFSILNDLEPARIIAPPGLSFPIAEMIAANGRGHTLASLSFHRAAPGISRVATAFTSKDAEARAAGLAPFDVVAVCRRDTRIGLSGAPLYAALASGKGWPGLRLIGELPATGLHLYRIDHENLR